MRTKQELQYDDAKKMLSAACRYAEAKNARVSICVVDDAGMMLAFARLDGASPQSSEIALYKARTAALHRKPTQFFETMVANGRTAALSMPNTTLLGGGEPIIWMEHCIGAVGVSGVTPDLDAEIAKGGIDAL